MRRNGSLPLPSLRGEPLFTSKRGKLESTRGKHFEGRNSPASMPGASLLSSAPRLPFLFSHKISLHSLGVSSLKNYGRIYFPLVVRIFSTFCSPLLCSPQRARLVPLFLRKLLPTLLILITVLPVSAKGKSPLYFK